MPRAADSLLIGGLTPLSTLDYPGELAAVLFCQGCPWNCLYCQNIELIPARTERLIPWQDAEQFLRSRAGLLDAVVFSGGEPTAQAALAPAMRRVKELGFKVGLHTAGSYPRRFESLLGYCDWVGLDIKALPDHYESVTGAPRSGAATWECLRLLAASGVRYEVRTTLHSELMRRDQLSKLAERLIRLGVRTWALQTCRGRHGNARNLASNQWPTAEDLAFVDNELRPHFDPLLLRHF